MKRTHDDLLNDLRKQIGFLKTSCASFDGGNEDEALRIATVLRVLVHDTSKSTSLLQQLGLKEKLQFIDSAAPIGPVKTGKLHNGRQVMALSGMPGLFNMRFTREGTKLVAPLDVQMYAPGPVSFDDWWNNGCIPGHDGAKHSRSWLIKQMANKEGGAHVDPEVTKAYAELQSTTMGMTVQSNGIEGFTNSPGNVSVRQIAWEILETLKDVSGP